MDDDAEIRRSLERLLLSAGFTPVLYATPSAVIEHASELSDGCMLLDVRLPGMDGLALRARLIGLGSGCR